MKEGINLRFKDKVFLFIIILGMILALYSRIFNPKVIDENREVLNSNYSQENLVNGEMINLKIGSQPLNVEVFKNNDSRYKGLSERDFLAEGSGALFVFPNSDEYAFVMRDMNFDLDFIFINDGIIVGIIKNISSDYEEILKGDTPYNLVIETNAGWSDQHQISTGEVVFIEN